MKKEKPIRGASFAPNLDRDTTMDTIGADIGTVLSVLSRLDPQDLTWEEKQAIERLESCAEIADASPKLLVCCERIKELMESGDLLGKDWKEYQDLSQAVEAAY